MTAIHKTGNAAFDAADLAAEATKQLALASATTQAAHNAAQDAFHQAVVDAGKTNGVDAYQSRLYLAERGILG
jgi:hypothetical protein